MGRREVAGTLSGTVLAGGIAAVIGATTLPAASAYFDVLIFSGATAIIVGLAGLLVLFFLPTQKVELPRAAEGPPTHGPINIDQRVSSVNQSGGITAHTLSLGRRARDFSDPEWESAKEAILIRMPAPRKVDVTATMGDTEAIALAAQIRDWLVISGYEVDGIGQAVWDDAVYGVRILPDVDEIIVGSSRG